MDTAPTDDIESATPVARRDILTDLTKTERALIDAARRGEAWECSRLEADTLRRSTDPDHLVRARLLRELLLGWHGGLDPRGVHLAGARVTGRLDARYIQASVGIRLDLCVVEQDAWFHHAHLPWLILNGSSVAALHCDGLRVDSDLFLRDQFTATSDSELGAIRLLGAHIGGNVDFDGAQLTNHNGPALHCDGMRVEGGLFLRDQFTATGNGERGAIRLLGAHIGGNVDFGGAQLTNHNGPALHCDRLRVEGGLFLRDQFTATGDSELGAIRLLGAHIGGNVEFDGAQLTNHKGPALVCDGMRVEGGLFLRDQFTATGNGERGAVRLHAVHVGSLLDLKDATLNTPSGHALGLRDARCSTLRLSASVICPTGQGDTRRPCTHSSQVIGVIGFTYTDLVDVSWEQWLHLLRRHTLAYQPQPYQQLAAMRTAAGHDRDTRRILITQQQDHRARGELGGPLRRTMHAIWGGLGGYGYRAGRVAFALLVVLLLAGGLGVWAGNTPTNNGQYAAQRPLTTQNAQSNSSSSRCSLIEQIGLGIDRGLPLASTGVRTHCDLDTASTAGQWFTGVIWLLQAVVWALATLAVAGYTGLVRKIH
jgi:hypothetical protein